MTICVDPMLVGYVAGLLTLTLPLAAVVWAVYRQASKRYDDARALHREHLARVDSALHKEG